MLYLIEYFPLTLLVFLLIMAAVERFCRQACSRDATFDRFQNGRDIG